MCEKTDIEEDAVILADISITAPGEFPVHGTRSPLYAEGSCELVIRKAFFGFLVKPPN